MTKVMITGGAGYVGSHVNKVLNETGYETVVLDSLERGYLEFVRWGKVVVGRVGDANLVKSIIREHNITDIIHLASYAYVAESAQKPLSYWKNNLVEAITLFEAAAESGIKRIVFSSSCATYGEPKSIPINELHQQAPISPYGASKLAVEQVLKEIALASGIKCAILRYFNAAGAAPNAGIGERHIPETHLIPLVLEVAAGKRKMIDIFGTDYETHDGTCVRDYVHVGDLAQAHLLALRYLNSGGESESFNLGLGRGYSVMDIVNSCSKVTGKKIRTQPLPRRLGDATILVADARRSRSRLGWVPKYTEIDSIIETAWGWHQCEWSCDNV